MNDDFRHLHHEWDSPGLWPRIAAQLERERKRRLLPWFAIAASVLIALGAAALWSSRPRPADPWMLSEQALRDVEVAEAAYARSIGKLAEVAGPALAGTESPVLESYREKLKTLDTAIAELHAQAAANPYHPHLRVQLAALYREKQESLQEVLRAR